MDPILERYQALEDKVSAYTPGLDTQRLYRAFTYADAEHKGQLRKDGTPISPIPGGGRDRGRPGAGRGLGDRGPAP